LTYTDLATCPLLPAGNRLPVAVEAGEKIPYERPVTSSSKKRCLQAQDERCGC
jgi:hypothetical protein